MYAKQARVLLPGAAILYLPLGALDALGDEFNHVEIVRLDVFTGLLLAGALGQFAAASIGDEFYAGFAAAAVIQARTGERHRLLEIARRLPYGRLIAADLLVTVGTSFGLLFLVVPGIVFFTWFSLTAPLIKIENLGLRAGFRRSRVLVRGSFWPVLILLGGLYFGTNATTSTLQGLGVSSIGETFLGSWASAIAVGVVVQPVVAVVTVVVALELIDLHGRGAAA